MRLSEISNSMITKGQLLAIVVAVSVLAHGFMFLFNAGNENVIASESNDDTMTELVPSVPECPNGVYIRQTPEEGVFYSCDGINFAKPVMVERRDR